MSFFIRNPARVRSFLLRMKIRLLPNAYIGAPGVMYVTESYVPYVMEN